MQTFRSKGDLEKGSQEPFFLEAPGCARDEGREVPLFYSIVSLFCLLVVNWTVLTNLSISFSSAVGEVR